MDFAWQNLQTLAHAMLFSLLMFLFSRMIRSLEAMREKAKFTWQKALTNFLISLFGFIGLAAIVVIFTGID